MPISRANEFEALINDESKEHCQTFRKKRIFFPLLCA